MRIEIYNLIGERVSVIEEKKLIVNKILWQVEDVAPGLYFYKTLLTVDGEKKNYPLKN